MILTYSFHQFQGLIEGDVKIHTVREDKSNRWIPGRSIQHWMHNPRNVAKNPFQFAIHRDDLNSCKSIQYFHLYNHDVFITDTRIARAKLYITIKPLDPIKRDLFAIQDGFESWSHMSKYFTSDLLNWKIIHFTDFMY